MAYCLSHNTTGSFMAKIASQGKIHPLTNLFKMSKTAFYENLALMAQARSFKTKSFQDTMSFVTLFLWWHFRVLHNAAVFRMMYTIPVHSTKFIPRSCLFYRKFLIGDTKPVKKSKYHNSIEGTMEGLKQSSRPASGNPNNRPHNI